MSRKILVLIIGLCVIAATVLFAVGCGEKATTKMEVLQLDSGSISGVQEDGTWTYKGIPYAAPPVGELRWREPQPVTPWEDVLACTEFGPACPQPAPVFPGMEDVGPENEDCLYLNVWTPAQNPDEGLPVMFWIYGGGFTTGSSAQAIYNGSHLAEKGVVVVTINYRLGPLGFLAHPLLSEESPYGVSGNYGLLDQIAALEWVQENIQAFGGDPDAVTIFGESAGGASVCDLVASPLTDGLFAGAISESGGFLNMGIPRNSGDNTLEQAEARGQSMAQALGCDQSGDVLSCMRAKTPDEIQAASDQIFGEEGSLNWQPIVDGRVLPDKAQNLFAQGKQQSVPLLIGTNANEGSLFALALEPSQYQPMVESIYGANAGEILAMYPPDMPGGARAAFSELMTEMDFAAPSKFAAASMDKAGAPSYLYEFTMTLDEALYASLGTFHALELFYVFGNMDTRATLTIRPEDETLSEAMMDYWTNFAKTGDPNGDGLPEWPVYDIEADKYQELGKTISTQTGYYPQAYQLLLKINGLQ